MEISSEIRFYLDRINLPKSESHKGQNGKLLVIGGSELFHSSIFWAADVASKIVDMVHFSSPVNENNKLIRLKIKSKFWTGIVVDWSELATYITEDDTVVIGPGMERSDRTTGIVNQLLSDHKNAKWVIDGGALQMVDPKLLNHNHILTPHHQELELLLHKFNAQDLDIAKVQLLKSGVTIVAKGPSDEVWQGEQVIPIAGGNAGMTKGGTGDVLAGLVAALYCRHDALTAAVVGSLVNKKAAEELWQTVGPYFSAGDLVEQVPKTLWHLVNKNSL